MGEHPTSHESEPGGLGNALLEARGMTVRFGPVTALEDVGFSLRPGEVHALMGENGAGKSTLIKCLTGVLTPTAGAMCLAGSPVRFASPREAEAASVGAVFQEIGLASHLPVAENICLGREPMRRGLLGGLIDWSRVRERAKNALGRLGMGTLDVARKLETCSIAVQQLVAIARALDANPRVLILDEPTSSLDREEVERLFTVLRRLRGEGLGIVIVTHVLEQVEAIADRVTVLRDGRLVGVREMAGLRRAELVSMMVGREFDQVPVAEHVPGRENAAVPVILAARGVGRRGALERVDLEVRQGEAVGLAGLLGSGRSETARVLFGADTHDRGEVIVAGTRASFRNPREAIVRGIAMTPENRKADGIVPSLSVRENIVLALQAKRGLRRRVPRQEQGRLADMYIRSLGIKTRDAETPISQLSGGNQQKALLARWLATEPRVLILDEPTRGIDVAAKAEILRVMHELRAAGMAIVFISSELDEVARTCDRVVVLRDRRSIAELSGSRVSEHEILAAISREKREMA